MKKIFTITLLLFVMVTPALAEVAGEISLGGRFVSGDDAEQSAKFLEYRDLDDQLTTDLNVFMDNENYYLTLDGENLGYDDQSFKIGGSYFGQARFKLFYDELTHNYSLDDLSAYNGVGTNNLTIPANIIADPHNIDLWMPLDYSMDRQQVGAMVELTFNSPFFLSVDVTRTDKEGIIPWGVNISDITGGSDAAEIPAPINNVTTNMVAKAGYRTKSLFAQADLSISQFDNDSSKLGLPNTGDGDTDTADAFDFLSSNSQTLYLAPENDMIQVGAQLTLRDLPMHSVLAIRTSHSKMESDAQVIGAPDGELTYTKAGIRLHSRPIQKLATELSYNYLQKDNKAASFLYNGNETHVFEYTKQHFLLAASYRLTSDNRFKAGYDFLTVDRSEMRFDAEETDEHTLFAEWKNSSLDALTGKIRYEHMTRSSDFQGVAKAIETGDDIYRYVRPYDTADKDGDKVRLMLEATPVDMLDLGFELNASKSDYDETVIGRTEEKATEVIVDAALMLPHDVKLYGYYSYEVSKKDSNHVYWPGFNPTALDNGVPIPTALEAGNQYNWYTAREDKTDTFGVKLEVPLLDNRLRLSSSYDYQKNDGDIDFTANPSAAILDDISAYDDYKIQTFELKAEYDINESFKVAAGYVYEKYELDDLAYNDYFNIDTVSPNYLTGAYADLDYEADIGYVTLSYKF